MTYPQAHPDRTRSTIRRRFLGTMPDKTISAAAHRRGWKKTEAFINWLFRDDMHCAKAYISEMDGTQTVEEYRK